MLVLLIAVVRAEFGDKQEPHPLRGTLYEATPQNGASKQNFLTYTIPNNGRMANQLFTIAAAMGIAERFGFEYCHGLRAVDTGDRAFFDHMRVSFDWSVSPRCTDEVVTQAAQFSLDASFKSPTKGPGQEWP
jgi:hypothetical protein